MDRRICNERGDRQRDTRLERNRLQIKGTEKVKTDFNNTSTRRQRQLLTGRVNTKVTSKKRHRDRDVEGSTKKEK
jgi:hypothetical protein